MKCPNCGAEIGAAKVCEFCGSQVPYEMQKQQEVMNKKGCPRCGSTNITFTRENQGEIKGKSGKRIVHQTVGFCKDCGATWYPSNVGAPVNKRKTWLWVLGWLLIFPVPLTILMLRKKEMKPALRYGIIAAAWIVYLIIGLSGRSSNNNAPTTEKAVVTSTPSASEKAETTPSPEVTEKVESDKLLDVSIEVEPRVNDEDGTVLFGVTTNLPEDTELLVTVSKDGYTAQDKVVILKNGTGYTSEFSDHGGALNGTYTVNVSMSLPALQKESVRKVIGEKGEYINGPLVEKSSIGSANTVSAEFEFTFEGVTESGDNTAENMSSTEEAVADPQESLSTEQKNAISSAQSYLSYTGFSKAGLIDQLSSEYGEKYPEEVAAFAVQYLEDNNLVDWTKEAIESAQSYIDLAGFSRAGLIGQLTSEYGEQFTEQEAADAIQYIEDNNLVNWNEEAVEAAQSYLKYSSFSREGLYDQLTSEYGEQFTPEQANYALEQVYDN